MAFDPRWKNPPGPSPQELYLWAQSLITELRRGHFIPSPQDAAGVAYDNTVSGLAADNVQDAIDEEDARIDALEAVPPGLVLLASGTVVNAATLDIVLTAFTGYRGLKFLLTGFVPVADDRELWMRFSTDGGANYDAAGYSYTATWSRDGSANANASSTAAAGQIAIARSQSVNESVSNVAAEGGATRKSPSSARPTPPDGRRRAFPARGSAPRCSIPSRPTAAVRARQHRTPTRSASCSRTSPPRPTSHPANGPCTATHDVVSRRPQ